MDPIKNPFSPGAGSPPPELVGRDPILDQARILLGRVKLKKPEKSLLLTGLRGVGKTVLLNEIDRLAQAEGYRTISIEAHEGKSLGHLMAPHLRRLLYELDRMAGVGDKVKRGLAILSSFIKAMRVTVDEVAYGLDIDPEIGTADSGDLEIDLPSLLVGIGEAAENRGCAVAILIDEVQYFSAKELAALIMAMHKIHSDNCPSSCWGRVYPSCQHSRESQNLTPNGSSASRMWAPCHTPMWRRPCKTLPRRRVWHLNDGARRDLPPGSRLSLLCTRVGLSVLE